ncbi:FmdB family zinc ribbon protein [Extensimonas sp. H3M7-6]|uniref:FmdB family zinc ribbon protein n=1 Tax=Extensimonas soli TaxID=3031322 RepID=UPI0023DAF6D9|nr:zinc ribbon domain-containing protein [Extensimonas sp. H3M7-6]MDF1483505.1 zinc ribbon domain-containing protein [Extensimonas sp. H3M7-6]
MPMYDYRCQACGHGFEALVRAGSTPVCPNCGSSALEKCVSAIAPAGRIEAMRMSNRRAAAAQGLFDHYSPSDKAKLLQGKKGI